LPHRARGDLVHPTRTGTLQRDPAPVPRRAQEAFFSRYPDRAGTFRRPGPRTSRCKTQPSLATQSSETRDLNGWLDTLCHCVQGAFIPRYPQRRTGDLDEVRSPAPRRAGVPSFLATSSLRWGTLTRSDTTLASACRGKPSKTLATTVRRDGTLTVESPPLPQTCKGVTAHRYRISTPGP